MLPKYLNDSALRNLGLLTLRSRRTLMGITQGTHISLKRGHGIEFSDYRNYQPGDNPRDIDWNLYARSDRMYVKTFNEEQNLAVYIIVDGSWSMRLPEESNKWDYAASVALGLAYVALSQRDEVSIAVLGAGSLFRVRSLGSFASLGDLFYREPEKEPDLVSEFRAFLGRLRAPGILIFLSDFLFDSNILESLAQLARSKNLDTSFIQILSNFDREPYKYPLNDVIDGETGTRASLRSEIAPQEFDAILAQHNNTLRDLLAASTIRLVSPSLLDDPISFIGSHLHEVGMVA